MSRAPIEAMLMESNLIVWDLKNAVQLYREGFYGKPVGVRKPKLEEFNRPLELSYLEGLYLAERGRIKIVNEKHEEIPLNKLMENARRRYGLFDDTYKVYKDLRDKGYVIKPGMKFGASFAVYKYGPGIDHAPFLVQVLPSTVALNTIDIVRAGRLSHSVRKRFIIATINKATGELNYYMFKWFKA